MDNAAAVLQKYWGYTSFRPLQEEIIHSVLEGNDTLALMPTGGGKSICFQVPAMMKDGLCLVISPLIALMKDQVFNLKKRGIPALALYSGMHYADIKKTIANAAYGNFKFLYVSPERLETKLFLDYLPVLKINLIAVDEAHCISQWGYDFRPPYLRIATVREVIKDIPVLAMTASATLEVQDDICEKLQFKNNQIRFQQSFERSNLSYSVFNLSSKQNKLLEILHKVKGSGIVYCKSRRRTKEIEELLNENGIAARHYHAGLSGDERNARQDEWIQNKARIIACTNAFGMGIDKPDVRVVVHYDVPEALENYYQEAGRAGRDEKKAYAVLLCNEEEIAALRKVSDIKFPDIKTIKNIYASLVNYFQLAAGAGEDLYFDFDINDFVKKFKQDVFIVNNVLKILEQEELLTYNEQFFSPSTVVFTIDKNDLEIFEKNYPEYDAIMKGLLRLYEGIFTYTSSINEQKLAKFISAKKEKVIAELTEIHALGIINYTPQKEKPQLHFLQNRVAVSDLVINQKNFYKRKYAFEKRLNAMLSYTKEEHACRSKMIGAYFNDTGLKRCGVCDNCLNEKSLEISKDEFEKITSEIKIVIAGKTVQPSYLLDNLKTFQKKKVMKILHFLQDENLLSVTNDGLIKAL